MSTFSPCLMLKIFPHKTFYHTNFLSLPKSAWSWSFQSKAPQAESIMKVSDLKVFKTSLANGWDRPGKNGERKKRADGRSLATCTLRSKGERDTGGGKEWAEQGGRPTERNTCFTSNGDAAAPPIMHPQKDCLWFIFMTTEAVHWTFNRLQGKDPF